MGLPVDVGTYCRSFRTDTKERFESTFLLGEAGGLLQTGAASETAAT